MKIKKENIKSFFKKVLILLKYTVKTLLFIIDKTYLAVFIIFMFVGFAWWSSQTPSLYRDWNETESILPEITFNTGSIDIKKIRNYKHLSETNWISAYYDDSFELDKLDSVYYIIEPFSDYDGLVYTMLSFGFSDGRFLTISAEIRKEKGESFDPFLGTMNQYEMVYIVGNENDLVKLRANIRKDTVRMYPIKADKNQIKELFVSVLHRADKLTKEPEFYNTLWNTCTTSILKHVNSLRKDKISGFDLKVLLPSNSDKIAYDLGLVDTKLSLIEAREYYKINSLSEQFKDDVNYEKKIRREKK